MVGEVEQAGEPPARKLPAGLIQRERHGRRERRARLRRDGLQRGRGHLRALDSNGKRNGQSLEARERRDDRRGGGFAVELATGPTGHDLRVQAPEPKSRVAVILADLARELADHEIECGLVDLSRRVDVRAEDPHADPAQPAERAEALSLAARRLDARAPVDLHAELARPDLPRAPCGAELDRHVAKPVGAALEAAARVVGVQTADGHAGDPRAGGQLGRRACEGEAEEGADADEHCRNEQRPLPDEAAPRAPSPRPQGTVGGTRAHVVPHSTHRCGQVYSSR